ncbi:electron transfer flavoprotein beta subunit lysine methyltransferase [Nerophis ophidion]|uniref:electron transfer flavoprotein beta subunit lysine methyltransferase n=1 Tax=Nerophis ophidion TaxID=159077 RepID=UPI002ADFC521|nr:electron transfer flavoprotein beta subunit lysine methyltransferase [Nerophis ophidion]
MLKLLSTRRLVCHLKSLKATKCSHSKFVTEDSVRSFILENTETVEQHHLTPEVKLRLFTSNCRYWHEKPELWPFDEPYWAIYWPGGQALSRYLLDNPGVCKGKSVLDLGSGCGASAIAAKLCGAACVVANDIDPVAVLATCMNFELNGLDSPVGVTENMIGSEPGRYDLILLGDMFYDEVLSRSLYTWLEQCVETNNSQVLIGDPGRDQLEESGRFLQKLAHFELPKSVQEENYGFTFTSVWRYHPQLSQNPLQRKTQ